MAVPFVDLKAQWADLKEELLPRIVAAIEAGNFIGGRAVADFESHFAAYCGVGHCVGVGNGTDALYLALRGLGVQAGDEVITAANTFIATSEAISMTGARVVFVDCDPETYTMDVRALTTAITPRTKAIVPVHLYGRPADMDSITRIAAERQLFVVEDAAQAHGAMLGARRCGSFGHAACFSFYPGKNLGGYGDAGAVVTDDPELAKRIRMLANHGRIAKYDHEFEGVNSRLDALQAVVLDVKLSRLEDWTERRRTAASQYHMALRDMGLPVPGDVEGGRHVYHLYVTRVPDRERVQAELSKAGIATGIHYPIALPNLTAYRQLNYRHEDFPVASRYQDELISLPMFPEITSEQIDSVCKALACAIDGRRP
ncbi:MAG: DegT/DnrJ/EryC1/StrS family aminotransferase [Alphaproteobacteria bacterium]|nr:DegT/DnrJ/EryC1/StrS family aminotransferase [Alphaproteobacteria bacterium]